MKRIITILAISLIGITSYSQEMLSLSALGSTDSVAVMEQDIYKVTAATDSTATVEYMFNTLNKDIVADTSVAKILALTFRLFTPTGLGYSINADRIKGVGKLTDSTCYIYYMFGNAKKKVFLDLSTGGLTEQINALTAP